MVSEDKVALALSKRNQESREEKIERIRKRNQFEHDSKLSHDWESQFVIDRLAGKGSSVISHCKKYGINYWIYKTNPVMCSEENK